MKKLHKQPACLNCNRPLADADNFCPSCGQENTSAKLSFGQLLHDFFSNYFSFDSKISRSVIPFLIQPGLLTLRFNEGKRNSYIHPLRLYIIISFLFSLALAFLIDKAVEDKKLFLFSEIFKEDALTANKSAVADSIAVPSFQVKVAGQNVLEHSATDSIKNALASDTTVINAQEAKPDLKQLLRDESLTDEEVLKKMKGEYNGPLALTIVHQARKVIQKDMDVFLPYVMKNLSIMMFLLLPVFAFYLYVLFGRKERFYISHATHALHLHSFSFMIITLLIVLEVTTGYATSRGWVIPLAFLLITLYAFFSVKRVYKDGWLKTIFKFNVLGLFYFITLCVSFFFELAISFALF